MEPEEPPTDTMRTDEDAYFLPYNYLPASLSEPENAFGLILDPLDPSDPPGGDGLLAVNRKLLRIPSIHSDEKPRFEYYVVSQETLRDPVLMQMTMATLNKKLLENGEIGETDNISDLFILGPVTSQAPTPDILNAVPLSFFLPPIATNTTSLKRVVVIIDYGIAFWNKRLCNSSGKETRFSEIRFLNEELKNRLVPSADLNALVSDYKQSGREDDLLSGLKAGYPDSFYGDPIGPYPDDFWHGTAIADIAVGGDEFGEETLILGIELPRASINDPKGDVLTAVLPVAVQMAIWMTSSLKRNDGSAMKDNSPPLFIAAPFAFPAALHDGSHPAAKAITAYLAGATSAGRPVTLVLPAGNNLQDRGCACLLSAGGVAVERHIAWHIPPDDFSPNSAEILVDWTLDDAEPIVTLAPPGMAPIRIDDLAGAAPVITAADGTAVGRVVRRIEAGGKKRFRISLFPTGRRTMASNCAPFGEWTISVASLGEARLWILRDDTERYAATDPVAQSYFDDPDFRERNEVGDFILDDTQSGRLVRSGSASVLTTASGILSVQANERLEDGSQRSSTYSARRLNGSPFSRQVVVEDRRTFDGIEAVGNGSDRLFRVQGTSAAVGVVVRDLLRAVP